MSLSTRAHLFMKLLKGQFRFPRENRQPLIYNFITFYAIIFALFRTIIFQFQKQILKGLHYIHIRSEKMNFSNEFTDKE